MQLRSVLHSEFHDENIILFQIETIVSVYTYISAIKFKSSENVFTSIKRSCISKVRIELYKKKTQR